MQHTLDARAGERASGEPRRTGYQSAALARWSDARPRSEWVVAGVAMVLAWIFRFVQDDAFISFRYAHNLAVGRGLVFNTGDRVEGYTNFLWTLILWIPERFGWDPVLFSALVSIALMGGTVMVAFRLADRVLGRSSTSFVAVLFLVGTASFISYGTGGLETILQTVLLCSIAVLALRALDAGSAPAVVDLLALSVLGGLAVLTRPDSVVLVGFWFLMVLWSVFRSHPGAASVVRVIACLGLPATVLLGPWLVWKTSYYGSILPNTFVAKASSPVQAFVVGGAYLAMFGVSYGLVLLIPALFKFRSELWRTRPLRLVTSAVALWCCYLMYSGADFMEFRFMVPVLPLVMCLVALVVSMLRRIWRFTFVAVFAVLSLAHLSYFPYPTIVSSFRSLDDQVTSGRDDWSTIGQRLADLFPGGMEQPGQVVIAVGPAGAMPYYSDLPTIDQLGLNDEWVARNGVQFGHKPGHLRHAPISYLVQRGVNLVIGLPHVVANGAHDRYSFDEVSGFVSPAPLKRSDFPADAKVLEIPLDGEHSLAVVYLTPNPAVERHIAEEGWRVVPID